MNDALLKELFSLEGKVAVVTVGTGVLGGAMAQGLASLGAKVAVLGRNHERAAKAVVDNFTRWLAVELARKYGAGMRVNAIAPGFFVGEQNRALLLNPDGSLTARGNKIIDHTPAGRFGEPEELLSTLGFLCGT